MNGPFLKLTPLRRASEDAIAARAPGRLDRDDWAADTTGHEEFTILHSNVRGFISRVAELSARLRLMESKPSVLCLTETWADKGLPSLRIEGYTLISGRDRDDGRLGGGVAVLALEKLAHRVTHLENSQIAERSWVIIHSDHGPCVIGCWYRPPAPGYFDSIRSFKEEAQLHATNAVGCVLLGDLNIHHRKVEVLQQEQPGRSGVMYRLQRTRDDTAGPRAHSRGSPARPGVVQLLRKTGVLPMVADHKPITATLKLCGRKVWRYGQADWERLRDSLADTCWDHIADQSTTTAAKWITDTILLSASSCIPLSTLSTKKILSPVVE